MPDGLGPRGQRVYHSLRYRLASAELTPGARLGSHLTLAAEFDVSPVTMRRVLAQLEREGLIWLRQGRGTFVRHKTGPGVMVVDIDRSAREELLRHVQELGYRGAAAAGPDEGLAMLKQDPAISLVLADVRLPDIASGVDFVRAVHHRRPNLWLAMVICQMRDLDELHGTRESPVLFLSKPVCGPQLNRVLRLVLHPPVPLAQHEGSSIDGPSPPLVAMGEGAAPSGIQRSDE
jgi:DNA-binding transcriptional regulator YhcF (GntR family)